MWPPGPGLQRAKPTEPEERAAVGGDDRDRELVVGVRAGHTDPFRAQVSTWRFCLCLQQPAGAIRLGQKQLDHDACYKPYAIFDGRQWLLWCNGRHGGLEQIGVVFRPGEDLGF